METPTYSEQTLQKKGFIPAQIPEGLDLKEEILRLKEERNAVLLAHYYQEDDGKCA